MRKLKSKHTETKKHRRNQITIGVILIFVMFGSVFGIVVGSFGKENDSKKINYNGYEFIKQNNFWVLNLGDFQFAFKYNPNEVEKIDSELEYLNHYYDKPLYISSENSEATSEIYTNLNQIVQRMQSACLEKEGCEENLPVKTCENNFIIITKSNETKIIQNESCVFIQGAEENLTKISDEFLFKIMGIRE